ncbi:Protein tyrosine phosphatase domain-containing protein [Dirofilaria immitis]
MILMKRRKETRNMLASCRRVPLSHMSIRYGVLCVTPWSWRCKLYCNGANCKYCSWKSWSLKEQAIRGLYSSWITGNIVAMSRPTAKTFTDDNLIAQFQKANIRAVINLQMLGEHDSCGPELLPSGFTYNPEILMQNGIQFYNFVWPDFGALGIDILLDIVKVVHCSLRQGKVAIHCHAGLGRTGVLIAAYMIWAEHFTYAEAIDRVRTARPNSVQSKKQIRLVKDFEMFLEKNGAAIPKTGTIYLKDYMHMQVKILASSQARKYHHIPKVLHVAMEELLLVVHGELDGRTRRWIANILKCTSRIDREFQEKLPARLPFPSKMKSQEIDICICGIMENSSEISDSSDKDAKIIKDGAFKINNCTKFIRTYFRGNMLLLLRTLDQLMNSFIKPIIPKEELLGNLQRNDEHTDWQCLNRYLLVTMASLCNGNHRNIAKLISQWYLSESASDDEIIVALQNRLLQA